MVKEPAGSIYYDLDADTLDIWLGNASGEAYAEPITENVVRKHNRRGDVVGFEIVSVSKLNGKDMKKMPAEARSLLRESVAKLAVVGRQSKQMQPSAHNQPRTDVVLPVRFAVLLFGCLWLLHLLDH